MYLNKRIDTKSYDGSVMLPEVVKLFFNSRTWNHSSYKIGSSEFLEPPDSLREPTGNQRKRQRRVLRTMYLNKRIDIKSYDGSVMLPVVAKLDF